MKSVVTTLSAILLFGGTALAAQNVANTSQKGSLLIWPLINVDPAEGADTIIEISNDATKKVKIECYYVNERKGRVDFDFWLTPKQTVSWSVRTQDGDGVQPPEFPTGGDYVPGPRYAPASFYRGELVCFATNYAVTAQIAFNHLTGTATVVNSTPASETLAPPSVVSQGFRYNAWSFVARDAAGLPARDNVRHGTPGHLLLTGGGAGTYDACPVYNIVNFMPNGATLGGVQTISNALTVVSCNQDLRQDYELNLTKLQFTVWNSHESSFTGAYICVDSVNTVPLGRGNGLLVNGSNFEYSTLRTENARFHVLGVKSTQCPASIASALLGVHSSEINSLRLGSTTHGAGSAPGFVRWDPFVDVPHKPARY